MTDKIELKPCPFCGGEARITEYTNNYGEVDRYRVSCGDCGALKDAYNYKKCVSIKAWNTRTDERAEMKAAIVELRSSLHQAKMQIEYLHGKFKETGSGNAVVTQCSATLNNTKKWSE